MVGGCGDELGLCHGNRLMAKNSRNDVLGEREGELLITMAPPFAGIPMHNLVEDMAPACVYPK